MLELVDPHVTMFSKQLAPSGKNGIGGGGGGVSRRDVRVRFCSQLVTLKIFKHAQ